MSAPLSHGGCPGCRVRRVKESKGLARGAGKEGGAALTAETPQFYTYAPAVWRLKVLKCLALYFITVSPKKELSF